MEQEYDLFWRGYQVVLMRKMTCFGEEIKLISNGKQIIFRRHRSEQRLP